ncbi:endolytic transglycosylase MltG [Moraxella bovis]|uniref:Endolytic murein transglycosylase n=1 Tax=Moraxella bovis TaxID=476 RepID=A0AAQ2T2H7_MORBO|nr:endolytic transglycosylase MltG [Moraxella bovis]AWY21546.1 endolytic transglycosylase MltG [Moraxella bovis]OOR89497.1 aminodeoxychorismate lyase [Moraxella bovis]UYZ75737.1 endolytic transglycosylase MltG [Moraxella bovis]UYZ78322.1 endolytic transglycosylase MltG [Moraxella bovis]UYZ81208.1 endolytic transglycosylase MltG [Moraxella bovis]
MPNKKTSKKSPLKWLALVVVLALIALWGAIVYVTAFAKTDRPAQTLTVDKGDTYHSLLVKDKWQTSPFASSTAARLYLKFHAKGSLETGIYQIPQGASLADVVKILGQGGQVAMIKVQIIEGRTVKDLYHTLKTTDGVKLELLTPLLSDADGYSWADVARDNAKVAKALNISTPNGNLEGQFAPNTYFFNQGTSDTVILKKLHTDQMVILDKAWAERDKDLPYKTPYDALIMASIIEKETGITFERNDVSAVFVNRLRQGMRLQTDPTIIYGLFDRYDGKIYRSNIDEKTDYNTYQIDGLPPTPITLPSAEAIEATMHPSDVPYIYFVATGKGGHKFSVTLDEHNKAVAEYRKVMAEK